MRNAFSAEWTKLLPHRATWLLVWLYPIAMLAVLLIGIFARLGSAGPGEAVDAAGWIDQTAVIWYLPKIAFGRYLIAAYVALVFAGEYGWNTWKLVVPHCARWKLLAAKYAVALALLYLAWLAAAAIAVAMDLVKAAVLDQPVPQGVAPGAIVQAHLALIAEGVPALLLTAAYASLAAVLTRSTLAAFILSIVAITIDQTFGKIVWALSAYGVEWTAYLYRILPGYHLENLTSWMHEGVGFQMKLAGGSVIAFSLTASLLVLAAWIGGLAALAFACFRRQDIN